MGVLLAQVIGLRCLTRAQQSIEIGRQPGKGIKCVFRIAAILQLLVAGLALAGFVCYLWGLHNRFHMLTADFLFALTEGDVVVWPADFELRLGPNSIFLATGSIFVTTSGLLLLSRTP